MGSYVRITYRCQRVKVSPQGFDTHEKHGGNWEMRIGKMQGPGPWDLGSFFFGLRGGHLYITRLTPISG